jgi:hypothetical protein
MGRHSEKTMPLLGRIPLEKITPSRVWSELDPETKLLAAQSIYAPGEQGAPREEANLAIATALRFRVQAVKKLPVEKRIHYLTRAVRPDDSLAATLLTTLHLNHRTEMLGAFLDALEIPQTDGVIDEEHELETIDQHKLDAAVVLLKEQFPADAVDVYLATLVSMDPGIWQGLSQSPGSD